MDAKTKSLIAVGAAAAVNCRPCLEHLVPQSIKSGASEDDIREAIETGLGVNRGARAKTQGYVDDVIAGASESVDGPTKECGDKATAAQTGCC